MHLPHGKNHSSRKSGKGLWHSLWLVWIRLGRSCRRKEKVILICGFFRWFIICRYMQKLILFVVIYLCPSLGVCVGGKNLNELFCLLSSHHLNSFVFQVSVRWENHTSPVFCLQLFPSTPATSTQTDTSFLHREKRAAARCMPLLCLCGAGLCLPEAEETS